MKKEIIECQFEHYTSSNELTIDDRLLFEEAKAASKQAYAPYSSFNVGSAVRLSNGKVITGTNQENIAYPSGLCAERVALFSAHSQYPNEKVEAIAVFAFSAKFEVSEIVSPCGGCRQVMAEYEELANQTMVIIMGSTSGIIKTNGINNLLPLRFSSSGLKNE